MSKAIGLNTTPPAVPAFVDTEAPAEHDDLTREFLGLVGTLSQPQTHALMILLENHDNLPAAYLAAFRLARALGQNRYAAAASAGDWSLAVSGAT